MNKFWKWMKEKNYGYPDSDLWDDYGAIRLYNNDGIPMIASDCPSEGIGTAFKMPKQMLIGYMIEYVNEYNLKPTIGDIANGYKMLKATIETIEDRLQKTRKYGIINTE